MMLIFLYFVLWDVILRGLAFEYLLNLNLMENFVLGWVLGCLLKCKWEVRDGEKMQAFNMAVLVGWGDQISCTHSHGNGCVMKCYYVNAVTKRSFHHSWVWHHCKSVCIHSLWNQSVVDALWERMLLLSLACYIKSLPWRLLFKVWRELLCYDSDFLEFHTAKYELGHKYTKPVLERHSSV